LFYPALSEREASFQGVCLAAEDNERAINNEEEGFREAQAAARKKTSCQSRPEL